MRIRYAFPSAAVNPAVLNAALETSTRANEALIRADQIPSLQGMIRRGRVRWQPERFQDGEHFDLAHTVAARGWGDCDDLAPWLAAELRARGDDEGAMAIARRSKSAPDRWHAVVKLSDGRVLDPSVWAGMHDYKRALRGAGVQRPMAGVGVGALGVKRVRSRFAARCDLPVDDSRMHVSGLGYAETLGDAIAAAVEGAALVGDNSEAVDEEKVARALALHAALNGDEDSLEGIADQVGDDVDIGFLPAVAALAPTALSMAKGLLPGGKKGAPMPPPGTPAAAAVPPGGGAPVSITPYGPGGPIIVRF